VTGKFILKLYRQSHHGLSTIHVLIKIIMNF